MMGQFGYMDKQQRCCGFLDTEMKRSIDYRAPNKIKNTNKLPVFNVNVGYLSNHFW
jgi:hypothetical protein